MRCEICEFRLMREETVCPNCDTPVAVRLIWDEASNRNWVHEYRESVKQKEDIYVYSMVAMVLYILILVFFYLGTAISSRYGLVNGEYTFIWNSVKNVNFPNFIVYLLLPPLILFIVGFGYNTHIRSGHFSSVLNTIQLSKEERITVVSSIMIICVILGIFYVNPYAPIFTRDHIEMLNSIQMVRFHVVSFYYYITVGPCLFHLFWTVFDINYIFERDSRIKEHRHAMTLH